MKIAILGSTRYKSEIEQYVRDIEGEQIRVRTATFDSKNLSELETCKRNRDVIEWADEVRFMWDGQSMGVVFDFGVCFALRKKVKMIYENKRTFSNLFKQMEEE